MNSVEHNTVLRPYSLLRIAFLTLSLASRLRSRRSASRRNRRRATAYTGLILGARRVAPGDLRVSPAPQSYPSSDDAQQEGNADEEDAHEPVCPRRSLARVVG